ncbi:Diaminopimelate epimerase [Buchnera aphidicola (Anoecia corni)]|uniref:Diaminopimelate epimerase n=2 Tax=Buchnera aphidicola TaxID=9 RepID=A0AAT9IH77_9GAMM
MVFSKMHGLGNDFMVVDNRLQNILFTASLIKKLSHRNLGIGFDQLLLLEKVTTYNIDFIYRIFNSNGTEVEQCGNGARCVAYFLLIKNITEKKNIRLQTVTRNIHVSFLKKNYIQVNMGFPSFKTEDIPCLKKNITENSYSVIFESKKITFSVVSLGNPHCVILCKNIKNVDIARIGNFLQTHDIFPKGVNVSFVEIINFYEIKLRVYERGVNKETRACGSGACASAVVLISKRLLSNEKKIKVNLPGGFLYIKWKGNNNHIYMTGSATHVYDGVFFL